ncbi:MAG: sulfite exporter TauE/SafE family protein [Rubrivivax sp.]|nr:sulfite exporter TauE/SafE family protein [Rubrivivax sp.]
MNGEGLLSPPLPPALLAFSLATVLAAGIVRGFAGFGFSAVSVAGLSLVLSPAKVVPAIFMLEVLASLRQIPAAARDVDRRWLGWLVLGNAVCIPLGIALLAWLPETPLRLLVGLLLLAAAVLQRRGFALGLEATPRVRLATGLVSGLVNGLAAIGGIAVAMLLNASALPPAAMRATMIALFLFTDLYALAWALAQSTAAASDATALLGPQTWRWALWLAPAMLAGIEIGRRLFGRVSPEAFRRRVLDLLMVVSALTVLRAAVALAG